MFDGSGYGDECRDGLSLQRFRNEFKRCLKKHRTKYSNFSVTFIQMGLTFAWLKEQNSW